MKHVFIITFGRSGGTALTMALNAIDGYCIRGENGNVIRPLAEAAGIAARTRSDYPDQLQNDHHPWHGAGLIRPDFTRSLAQNFVDNVLAPPPGTRATGFKEIRYVADDLPDTQFNAILRFMLQGFEDSRLIFLTRAPSEVAASGWWADRDRDIVIDVLEHTIERFEEAHETHADRSFMLDHETFDHDPEGLRPLIEWLGEDLPTDRLRQSLAERVGHDW